MEISEKKETPVNPVSEKSPQKFCILKIQCISTRLGSSDVLDIDVTLDI